MQIEVITGRAQLGLLRLPWCVDLETRTEPIRISDERHRIGEALSIRIRDVADDAVRVALSRQAAWGGRALQKIQAIVARAEAAGRPPEIQDSMGFRVGSEIVLMESCHRTCALYVLDPRQFELRILVVDGGWDAYFDDRLAVS